MLETNGPEKSIDNRAEVVKVKKKNLSHKLLNKINAFGELRTIYLWGSFISGTTRCFGNHLSWRILSLCYTVIGALPPGQNFIYVHLNRIIKKV